jgi:PTS system mannose-specific IID component
MQNIGFLLAIQPALRRLHRGEALVEACRRHAAYFNTHPYMAGYILGVAVRMEEEIAAGREASPEAKKLVGLVKNRLASPLAAVGDALYWETLRPLFSLVAVSAILVAPGDVRWGLAGVAAFLAAFSVPALGTRWAGIGRGHRHGVEVVEVLKRLDLQGTIRLARRLGLFAVGALTVLFVAGDPAPGVEAPPGAVAAARAAAVVACLLAVRWRTSPSRLVYACLAAGLCLAAGRFA